MTSVFSVGSSVLKGLKIVLNLIVLILYRTGFHGEFLGVGGVWNLNEEKNPDVEILASGVFVGYMIYTIVSVIALFFSNREFKLSFTDVLMNVIGVFMWIAVGATALHYWHGYIPEGQYLDTAQEKQVGLALGSLCIIQGAVYILDCVISVVRFMQGSED